MAASATVGTTWGLEYTIVGMCTASPPFRLVAVRGARPVPLVVLHHLNGSGARRVPQKAFQGSECGVSGAGSRRCTELHAKNMLAA